MVNKVIREEESHVNFSQARNFNFAGQTCLGQKMEIRGITSDYVILYFLFFFYAKTSAEQKLTRQFLFLYKKHKTFAQNLFRIPTCCYIIICCFVIPSFYNRNKN